MNRIRMYVAAALAVVSVGYLPASANAAPTQIRWNGSELAIVTPDARSTLGCGPAGDVTINGASLSSPIRCAEPVTLIVESTLSTATTVDLRNLWLAQFSRLTQVRVTTSGAGSTVYGSEFVDVINIAGGKAYGFDNYDVLSARGSAAAELWGGPGNDSVHGDGPGTFRLEGGDGDDVLLARSPGVVGGGPGNDLLLTLDYVVNDFTFVHSTASLFGGSGNDELRTRLLPVGTRVIDMSGGVDKVKVEVGFVAGTATKLRTVADPEPKLSVIEGAASAMIENTEKVDLIGIQVDSIDVVMQPTTRVQVGTVTTPGSTLKVGVPGGVWTREAGRVTAPGLAPVSWLGNVTVTVVAR